MNIRKHLLTALTLVLCIRYNFGDKKHLQIFTKNEFDPDIVPVLDHQDFPPILEFYWQNEWKTKAN